MKIDFSSRQAGFTLIELLVVISVTTLLASTILVSAANARRKARDAVRKENLKQLVSALELYYQDNGKYPQTGSDAVSMVWYSSDAGEVPVPPRPDDYIPGLAGKYLARLPKDPLGGMAQSAGVICNGWRRAYLYKSDGLDYKLLSHCGVESGNYDPADGLNDPGRDGGPHFAYAGTNMTTPPSDPNSPFNPNSCQSPPVPPGTNIFSGDGSYIWAFGVYSSPRSRCW